MPVVRRNEPISTWGEGDYIQGFALLARKEVRLDRNGREYMDLELADQSGSIAAKIWPDSAALKGRFDEKCFVHVKGVVRLYRETPQLTIEYCREATAKDEEQGFDAATLVPTTPESIDDLWARFQGIFPGALQRHKLRQLCVAALERHGDDLRAHPAAKSIHHAYRGGLLEHVVLMAELAQHICSQYPDLDRDLVLVGALFHDLGKVQELGAMPANDYTLVGQLIGHVSLGRDMLRDLIRDIEDFPLDLSLHLEHLVLSHQGRREYGSPIEPMTPEAIVLHMIDDLDSKLNQLRNARRNGGDLQFLKPMGRAMYFARPAVDNTDDDAPADSRQE